MPANFISTLCILLAIFGSVDFTIARPESSDLGGPCPGPPEKGPCNNVVHKWAYQAEKRRCIMFTWGGCAGNDKNRFDSEQQCMKSCTGQKSSLWKKDILAAPVPREDRGPELTFQETGKHKTFMFAQSNTFIQIDGDIIQTFQLRLCRQISFQFRTRLPHGLLVYHNVQVPEGIELELEPYALYVIVQQGQLKIVHVYGKYSTALIVGRGLNRDQWHSVTVTIDVHGARLMASVDGLKEETDLKGLHKDNNYGVSVDLTSVVLIGGLSSEEKLHGVKYIIESFVGCIRNVVLSSGKSASDLLNIAPLIATKHENVQEGCTDKCVTLENLCFVGSRCINHYYTLTCDCFGTRYEGEHCDVYTATVLTLRGSSYVSYRVYDWKDRVHSTRNRMSMIFRTRFDDSVLFYASGGDQGITHYIAACIKNNTVHLEMDFGDGLLTANLGRNVATNLWNNLTIYHENDRVYLSLNNEKLALNITGNHHLYIDPEIYIGGGPELKKKKGMVSHNNFAGCLKYVFYNDISIIYELRKMNPKVHYIGVLRPEFYEEDVQVIPITYPFASSHIWWPNNRMQSLSLKLDFKSSRSMAVLAASDVTTDAGSGYWEVRVVNEEIRFELIPDAKTNNVTQLISVKHSPVGTWHTVEVNYAAGVLKLIVDRRIQQTQPLHGLQFTLGDKVIVGSGFKINSGLVGCMRNVVVNDDHLDPRMVLQSERVVGEVALDDCQFVDPCHRPNTCEHGGKCSVKEDRLTCDCKGTGYIGKNCHFAEFRKTCEELALLGYTKPDVYLIDIDGNGRFPPAHVRCEFQSEEDSTKTIVEHNLPSQVDIRSASKTDFSFSIKYREFSAEMLQELVSHSLNCSQFIKYDCFKAPLELHSATWFISSANHTVDYLGDVKRGTCPCAIGRKCENPSQWCNCDVSEDKWNSDEGYYVHSNSLGITEMVFLQQPGLPHDAQGRITLGPLECVETNTQRYVVTFTTSQSYIEVPGWRKGDLAFSFRTTGEKAILLYQPPIRPNYPSFMVALTDDFQLTFNFTLNTGAARELVIKSGRRLNAGEWHKLWIDYNKYHVRFMINTDYQMVDLKPEEEFGPFEGSMFIGGAPFDLLNKSSVHQGLIGCFRGLVVNEEILDIYSYMSVHLSEIIKDCKPSCDPNPCKNGAMCRELWSTFQCVCQNPWAHIGQFCETNINTKALTYITPESYLRKSYLMNATGDEKLTLKSMMHDRVLLNLRTYDTTALILYANDHLNNFVHLHVYNGTQIVYMFNHGEEIHNITIDYPDLNSGKSVQLAIIKNIDSTTMHINEKNLTIPVGVLLLEEYSNKPWKNPEIEVLSPQRPPAPPTDYFQVNLGGYDPDNLLLNIVNKTLPGYVGCIRGLQIGDTVIDLPAKVQENDNHNMTGVLPHCKMKCDAMPCKHQGICIEDFRKQEHTCNCEHTSYYGEFCSEEKGADFSGESVLQRNFVLNGTVDNIKVQLAFSSNDLRQKYTVLLLIQTENTRSYYLLVALTPEGYLTVQEDREGSVFGATVSDRNFLNGARHSVYYRRDRDQAELMIDRQQIEILQIPEQSLTNIPETGSNEVQIGGTNTSDPRFAIYKGYNGCLSNIFLEVNEYNMKPLEEYMLFTKSGSEKVHVTNSHGVRSAQCADHFDIIRRNIGPTLNISQGIDKTWVEDPPERVPYKSLYSEASTEEEGTGRVVVITLSVLFVVVIIGCVYEVYRSDKQYRRRKEMETDASILRSKEQAEKMHASFKQVRIEEDIKPAQNGKVKPSNGATQNGANLQFIPLNDISPTPEKQKTPVLSERRISFRDSAAELEWDPTGEQTDLLTAMPEDEEDDSRPGTNENCNWMYSIPEEEHYKSASYTELTIPCLFTKPLSPVFLNEHKRTFGNPVSYLGGPRLADKPRTSIESVLSLD